jgi:BolA protein
MSEAPSVTQTIKDKLEAALAPSILELGNESHQHAHHFKGELTGETHFALLLVSAAFEGKSRVQRHQMVNEILKDELAGPVHALRMRLRSPSEG